MIFRSIKTPVTNENPSYFGQNLVSAVQSGQVSQSRVDVRIGSFSLNLMLIHPPGSRDTYSRCLVGNTIQVRPSLLSSTTGI